MKSTILSLFILISIGHYSIAQDCPKTHNMELKNDTTNHHFVLNTKVKKERNSCKEFIYELTNDEGTLSSFDIGDAYALSFYYQSGSKTSISISYASGRNWSKPSVIELKASPGQYHSLPLAIYANRFEFDITKLSRIKIVVNSKFATTIEELSFEYSNDKPNKVAMAELKERLATKPRGTKQK